MFHCVWIDTAHYIVENDARKDFGVELGVMLLDQGGGRNPRIIVILGNYSREPRLRHLSDKIEVIERTRSNRGPAVDMGIDAVLEDRINPSLPLVG
jgi:hypothetical protein